VSCGSARERKPAAAASRARRGASRCRARLDPPLAPPLARARIATSSAAPHLSSHRHCTINRRIELAKATSHDRRQRARTHARLRSCRERRPPPREAQREGAMARDFHFSIDRGGTFTDVFAQVPDGQGGSKFMCVVLFPRGRRRRSSAAPAPPRPRPPAQRSHRPVPPLPRKSHPPHQTPPPPLPQGHQAPVRGPGQLPRRPARGHPPRPRGRHEGAAPALGAGRHVARRVDPHGHDGRDQRAARAQGGARGAGREQGVCGPAAHRQPGGFGAGA